MNSIKALIHLFIAATILCCISSCSAPINESFKKNGWKEANQFILKKQASNIKARFKKDFDQKTIHYPPHRLAILGFKAESRIEVWAKNKFSPWKKIKQYRLTAKSGGPGPKLLEDDEQIPEGIYKINWLNPLSTLHLSMKLNYPNGFDRYFARLERRHQLGGDIFIHGKDKSVGCLAIGDLAIEELYLMVANTGLQNTEVIIASNDLRYHDPIHSEKAHLWFGKLNHQIRKALSRFV